MSARIKRVVVFGGNGYVGSNVLRILSTSANENLELTSISRRGSCPKAFENSSWSKAVKWEEGDALSSSSFENLLNQSTSVVLCLGSPPLPTFSEAAFQDQVKKNGTTITNVIDVAETRKVPRIVLVGASMPKWVPAGYGKGKQVAFDRAKRFSESDYNTRGSAVVVQPTPICGTRFTESGMPIPIGPPVSWILSSLESLGVAPNLRAVAPYLLENALCPFVHVEQVGSICARAALEGDAVKSRFRIVQWPEILDESKR